MVQLQNFFLFITSTVVPCGTAAPLLLKWFVNRDVPTGAPFSNGTLIPILIPSVLLLVYLHSRKFIGSMDGVKSGVLVRASCPLLLPDIIQRSSSETRALKAFFPLVPVLHFLLLESRLPHQSSSLPYLESFCGVLRLLFFRTFFSLPRDRSAKRERAHRTKGRCQGPRGNEQEQNDKVRHLHLEGGLEAPVVLASETASSSITNKLRDLQLMALGHDSYQGAKMNLKMTLSHGGVCIFLLGLLLSKTKRVEFSQRLPLGSELNMGAERCSLRGLDHLHGPTFHGISGNLMIYKPYFMKEPFFEDDESLRGEIKPQALRLSNDILPVEDFLKRWMTNSEDKNFCLSMFPEKRDYRERSQTTEVAIHTNPFSDLYALIGTGSARTGGWYTLIMKLPFIFLIWIGFFLASLGGLSSLFRQLKREKLPWNQEGVTVHNCIKGVKGRVLTVPSHFFAYPSYFLSISQELGA